MSRYLEIKACVNCESYWFDRRNPDDLSRYGRWTTMRCNKEEEPNNIVAMCIGEDTDLNKIPIPDWCKLPKANVIITCEDCSSCTFDCKYRSEKRNESKNSK